MESLVVMGFSLAFIVFSEIRNYHERKGLLDRVMAKDYGQYSTQEIYKKELEIKTPKQQDDFMAL